MSNPEGKHCPMVNKPCLLTGCAFFNELLGACDISTLPYNLYQLKEQIRALRKENPVALDNTPSNGSDSRSNPSPFARRGR